MQHAAAEHAQGMTGASLALDPGMALAEAETDELPRNPPQQPGGKIVHMEVEEFPPGDDESEPELSSDSGDLEGDPEAMDEDAGADAEAALPVG